MGLGYSAKSLVLSFSCARCRVYLRYKLRVSRTLCLLRTSDLHETIACEKRGKTPVDILSPSRGPYARILQANVEDIDEELDFVVSKSD